MVQWFKGSRAKKKVGRAVPPKAVLPDKKLKVSKEM